MSMIEYLAKHYKGILEWETTNGTLTKCVTYEEEVVVPEDITAIADRAFGLCPRLKTIRIPDSVTEIGTGVFQGCSHLINVHMPAHLLEGQSVMSAMWIFNEEIWNHPSLEYHFMSRLLDGTADYSDGFRDLFLRQLHRSFDAVRWIHRAIRDDKPHWVRFVLDLHDALPREQVDGCIRTAADAGRAEIVTLLLAYAQTFGDPCPEISLD